MKDSLILQDNNYISARRVAELFGYTSDYVGQLCRAGKLECKMIGRSWFVSEKSIVDHRSQVVELQKIKSEEKRRILKKIYNTSIGEEVVEVPILPKEPFQTPSIKLALATALCVISLFFVFQSISLNTNVIKNISNTKTTASIISASENFINKVLSYFSKTPQYVKNVKSSDFNGIAVAPSTNSFTEDEILKQKIKDTFSDEVVVKPDLDMQSGVITPVFKKGNGEDFVYVLVPVNPKK